MMKVPTFQEVVTGYREIARQERMKNDRPCESTVRNVVLGLRRILFVVQFVENGRKEGDGEVRFDLPLTWLTRRRLDVFLERAGEFGINATSARTYLVHLKALTARWTQSYYADRGWRVPPFTFPSFRPKVGRYQRPERRVLLKVKEWYDSLLLRSDKRDWLAATLMLEFAMRNGDIGRLRWSDFHERRIVGGQDRNVGDEVAETHVFLHYTPRKTSLSSGREVAWPVQAELWRLFCRIRMEVPERVGTHFQGLVVPAAGRVFKRLNRELKARHFFVGTHKGVYELRKICVDHVYQRFGAEVASSISGDDIRTVTRYYADPSAVNVVGVRVVDLL